MSGATPTYPITAVQDRLDLDLDGLKELLGISGTAEDVKLQLWLDTGKEEADAYCNNPFWEYDENFDYVDPPVELAIPNAIKTGIVEYVKAMREMAPVGVSEEEVGKLRVKYTRYATESDLLKDVARTWWRRHRLMPIG